MPENPDRNPGNNPADNRQNPLWGTFLVVWLSLVFLSWLIATFSTTHISYSQFSSLLSQHAIKDVEVNERELRGRYVDPQSKKSILFQTERVPLDLAAQLTSSGVTFSRAVDPPDLVKWLVPIILFLLLLKAFENKLSSNDASQINQFNFGKSRARLYKEKDVSVTFANVAGIDEVKAELEEVIEFLRCPDKFKKLGGRLPKGILLVGPPGTGKTLLAKAVAGETKRPFLSITGSEFVELYVGVGAARVRDLFQQASQNAPCIIFIDELDALGRARGSGGFAGGHDEKEQTLNQLLAELDGFDPRQGVILLAATNRPEILDPALLRAGRFDRQILVDRPDKTGRVQILKVHMKNVTLDPSVTPEDVASMTTGFTGAELANLVNEAALLATRRAAERIMPVDFRDAFERIVAGLEKKNRVINAEEREIVAVHEMGHALVGLFLNGQDPVEKISIIPRGVSALGYTMQRPQEDRYLLTESELKIKLAVLMGGRAAEHVKLRMYSTGASDDFEKATMLARHMVCQFGMSKRLGMVVYENGPKVSNLQSDGNGPLAIGCSQETAYEIEKEIRILLTEAFERACDILIHHKSALDHGAFQLMEKETLSRADLLELKNMTIATDSFEPPLTEWLETLRRESNLPEHKLSNDLNA